MGRGLIRGWTDGLPNLGILASKTMSQANLSLHKIPSPRYFVLYDNNNKTPQIKTEN
jgi:hypothetical protein